MSHFIISLAVLCPCHFFPFGNRPQNYIKAWHKCAGCSVTEPDIVISLNRWTVWLHEKNTGDTKLQEWKKRRENNEKDLWLHKLPQIMKKIELDSPDKVITAKIQMNVSENRGIMLKLWCWYHQSKSLFVQWLLLDRMCYKPWSQATKFLI